jgi:hypothetical protein
VLNPRKDILKKEFETMARVVRDALPEDEHEELADIARGIIGALRRQGRVLWPGEARYTAYSDASVLDANLKWRATRSQREEIAKRLKMRTDPTPPAARTVTDLREERGGVLERIHKGEECLYGCSTASGVDGWCRLATKGGTRTSTFAARRHQHGG